MTSLSPVARLILTLMMCLAPTVLFFGLYKGLDVLRDDRLIASLERRGVFEDDEVDSPLRTDPVQSLLFPGVDRDPFEDDD